MPVRRTLPAIAALAALALPAAAQAPASPALLIGSSSVGGAVGVTLERELREAGVSLERRAHSSSGFARPDYFDWEEEVDRLGALYRYRAVLIYAGGNDAQALWLREDERRTRRERWVRWDDAGRWSDLYAERVRAVVDGLCERGAPRVIVIPPADGGRERWTRRLPRVREAQRRGAEASRCGMALDGNDGARFESHDGVHLTRDGARRFWTRLELPLVDALTR